MSDPRIEPRKSPARFAVACVLAATVAGCAKPSSESASAPPSPPAVFHLEEATISQIQGAILAGQVTATQIVEGYLHRIKAYNGACVNQPDGVLGAVTPIQNARQLNALQTLNLRPETRKAWGFDDRKAQHDRPGGWRSQHARRAGTRCSVGSKVQRDRQAGGSAARSGYFAQGSIRHVRHAFDVRL